MFINKESVPVIALDSMNDVHFEEVEMLNAFYDQLKDENTTFTELKPQFDAIVQHTIDHFAGEEEKMLKYGFPPYPVHKGEHDRLLERATVVKQEWESTQDKAFLADFLERELRPWIGNHIQTMDHITAMFIANQGGE